MHGIAGYVYSLFINEDLLFVILVVWVKMLYS